jgi:hypothetical protein
MKMIPIYVLPVLLALGACGAKTVPPTDPSATTTSTTTARDAGVSSRVRKCEKIELTLASQSRLNAFVHKAVSNIEGPVTLCFTASGYNKDVSGTFRVEYEDDVEVRSFDIGTDPKNIFGGEIKITDNQTSIEVIFIDDVGFIQVTGTAGTNNSFSGKIRYYDFPTYEEALNQQVIEAQNKCKSGQMTVAQCMGYNFPPTFWWNETVYASEKDRLLAQAREILNDASKTQTLGTFKTDLTQVFTN